MKVNFDFLIGWFVPVGLGSVRTCPGQRKCDDLTGKKDRDLELK